MVWQCQIAMSKKKVSKRTLYFCTSRLMGASLQVGPDPQATLGVALLLTGPMTCQGWEPLFFRM